MKEHLPMLSILAVRVQALAVGSSGVAPVEQLGYALCWTQRAPADPLQDTAEPLSQDGSTCRKMYLRKGKTGRNEERKCVRNSPINTRFIEEGCGGGAPGPQQSRYFSRACLEGPVQSRYPHRSP